MQTFGFESLLKFGGDFRIFAENNLFAGVKNGDAAAVAAEHLSKFEADIATAEDEEMFGNGSELHDGFVGEIGNGIQAGERGNVWAAAGVDEDFFAFEQIVSNSELMRANKTCAATIEAKIGAFVDLFLLVAAKAEDDFVLLSDDFGEINADICGVDAPARGVARVVSNLRAVDHRFSGRAADVDAGAAEVFLLDERDGPSQIREAIGQGIAGLAGTDNDGVVLHGSFLREKGE